MGAAVAVAMRRARNEIVRHFTAAGATAPDRAVAYDPDEAGWPRQRIRRRLFRRMRDFGAIREVGAGEFYLDEGRLDEFRWSVRRRVAGLMALAAGAAAAAVALGA